MKMKGAHLTLDDRKIIQRDLENGMNRAQIAKELGKSPSTISKEIKLHKKFKLASAYGRGVRYFCENSGKFKECYGCKIECSHFKERSCKRRDKLGVCNKCPDNSKCYPGVQHLLHLKSKSKILRPIEIMGFFYEFFCQIQGNNLL